MSLSEPFIRRPVGTSLLTAAIVLSGALAFRLLPVSPLPAVDFSTISVTANLPDIQDQVGNFHNTYPSHIHGNRVRWIARGDLVLKGQRPIVPLQTEFGEGGLGTMGRPVVVRRQGANYGWLRFRGASS